MWVMFKPFILPHSISFNSIKLFKIFVLVIRTNKLKITLQFNCFISVYLNEYFQCSFKLFDFTKSYGFHLLQHIETLPGFILTLPPVRITVLKLNQNRDFGQSILNMPSCALIVSTSSSKYKYIQYIYINTVCTYTYMFIYSSWNGTKFQAEHHTARLTSFLELQNE